MKEFFTRNEKQTKELAKILAKEIKAPLVLAFQGNLGAGKTTFIQALVKALGIKSKITSPGFVLMKKYKNFYHIDCYRIQSYKDILELDFKEIISNNIVAIEWAEKIKKILPKNTMWLKFKILSEKERKIQIL